jgi:hypothetical protein
VSDAAGKSSVREWSATVATPPTAVWVAPAPDAEIYHGFPEIRMRISDNTPGARMDVLGAVRAGSASGPVIATFGGPTLPAGTHSFPLLAELPPGMYYLTAMVIDEAGNALNVTGATARRITTVAAETMTLFRSDCLASGCHDGSAHPATGMDCSSCHVAVYHEHAQCGDCHDAHTGPITVTGVTGNCDSCHNPDNPGVPQHSSASTTAAHEGSCYGCHEASLTDTHAGAPVGSAYPNQCWMCHANMEPVVATAIYEGDTDCSVCHGDHDHGVSHLATIGEACRTCHSADLMIEHVDRGPRCAVCHRSADPVVDEAANGTVRSTECTTCHPDIDFTQMHGYKQAAHTSSESCLGSCHNVELAPEHASLDIPVGCEGCHPLLLVDDSWDKRCLSCHGVVDHAPDLHVGSDAWVREYTNNFSVRTGMSWASYPMGCSSLPASRGVGMCHDISNVADLHGDLGGDGCFACHGPATNPADTGTECLNCHGTGWYNPATSSGTVQRPGSIHSSTGTSTVEAVGVGSEEPHTTVLTNDGATSYLRFYAANAEALFGRGAWWINPATTTITNVQVQFRARKLTAGTTASRMTALLDVGGSTYVSAAAVTNPSVTTYTLYTHTFTTNPKTGAAWTIEDLVDPDSVNGLRAFGVRQTASAVADIGVTEVLLKVNTPATAYPDYPVSGGRAHHYGNYLRSPQAPEGEWSSAIYIQYCYDRCHVFPNPYNYYGDVLNQPTNSPFGAYDGEWMWSSLMGDTSNNSPKVRKHTLLPVELPAGSPRLEFMTNYVLGTSGTGDWGFVEISVDSGESWVVLEGEEAGIPISSFSGTAGSWKQAVYDLSGYAGQTVELRWRYVNDIGGAAGWCIDNVAISEGGTVIFSDDAESERLEWDASSHWRRIKRALRWLG